MSETPTASPIADLSYRSYDGPLETRALRWWMIALANIRACIRKPMFWIWGVLSAGGYLISIIVLFFRGLQAAGGPLQIRWIDYFAGSLPTSLFFLFLLTLLIGSGSIAADNRANALLVYLSKPVTKTDYLVGKWAGIFVPLFAVAVTPALLLYAYCALSFTKEGFLSGDPLLVLRIILVAFVAAGLHSSLILGFSAWSRSPRMAMAVYAAVYLISMSVTFVATGIALGSRQAFRDPGNLDSTITTISAMSIPGLIQGLAQHIYRIGGDLPGIFELGGPLRRAVPPRPELIVLLAVVSALVVLSLLLAQSRVRAVEVVRG